MYQHEFAQHKKISELSSQINPNDLRFWISLNYLKESHQNPYLMDAIKLTVLADGGLFWLLKNEFPITKTFYEIAGRKMWQIASFKHSQDYWLANQEWNIYSGSPGVSFWILAIHEQWGRAGHRLKSWLYLFSSGRTCICIQFSFVFGTKFLKICWIY